MTEWLKNMLQPNYVRLLEEEVSRLRAENRALMNSLLGTAGFPPVEFPEAPKPQPLPRLRKRAGTRFKLGAKRTPPQASFLSTAGRKPSQQ